jgi:hypothetical protein
MPQPFFALVIFGENLSFGQGLTWDQDAPIYAFHITGILEMHCLYPVYWLGWVSLNFCMGWH